MARLVIPALPDPAVDWITAQSTGTITALGVKILHLCNPMLGYAVAFIVYLTERVAIYLFEEIIGKNFAFLSYGAGLLGGTLALHFLIVLTLPFQSHLLYIDLAYMLLRTVIKILYLTTKMLCEKYRDYLLRLWPEG